MKKFLFILLLIVISAVGVLSYMFYQTIDEENYKQQVITSARDLLGRQLRVDGAISVKLFPSPVITMSDVKVLNPEGFSNPNVVTINQIEAHIQFASLFKNPLVIQNVILQNPQIFLEKNKEGKINWDFAFLKPANRRIPKDPLLGTKHSSIPPQFQNMEINGGTITYFDQPMQEKLSFADIKGKLNAKTINGPFDFDGQIQIGKMPINAKLHLDTIGADIETGFNIYLSSTNSQATFTVNNAKITKLAEPTQEISGAFSVSLPTLSSFLIDLTGYKDLPTDLNKPVASSGRFHFAQKGISLDDLAFVYGDMNTDVAMSGKVSLVYPLSPTDTKKTDISLKFSQMNVDLFSSYLPKTSEWQKSLKALMGSIPDDTSFLLTSEKVTLFEKQLSNLSLKGNYRNNTANITEFSVLLPEKTAFIAAGTLTSKDGEPNSEMLVKIESENLGPTLEWLKVKTPLIENPAALHDADISLKMELTPEALALKGINAKVAGGQIDGNIAFDLTAPKLTALTQLQIQSLNFDNFVPMKPSDQKQTLQEALASLKNSLESSVFFSGADVQFDLMGNNLTFKNVPIQRCVFQGKTDGTEWITEKLDVIQAATADIRYSGTIRKKDGVLSFDNVNLNLDMPKMALLFERLKVQSPLSSTIGKLTANLTLSGSFNEMNFSLQSTLSQGRAQLSGVIKNILSEVVPYQINAKFTFPSLTQFVRLVQPTYKEHPNLTGSFNFEGLIGHEENQMSFKNTAVSIGPQKINFDIDLARQDEIIKATGKITSPHLYMDKFVVDSSSSPRVAQRTTYSKNLLDFSALDDLQLDILLSAEQASWENFETTDFAAHILLDQKILKITDVKAKIGEGTLNFDSSLNFSAATPYLKGKVTLKDVPVKPNALSLGAFYLRKGNASFTSNFDAKGNSADDMMRSLSASGNFSVSQAVVSGMNLSAFEHRSQAMIVRTDINENMLSVLNREFTTGETAFESIKGSYAVTNGLLRTTDTILKSSTSNALVQLDFNLPQSNVSSSAAITFNNLPGYPPVAVSVKGATQSPLTNIDLSSFVKYIESSAAETRNEFIRKQREQETIKKQQEEQVRVTKIADLTLNAEQQLEKARNTLQIASTETARSHMVRAQDAFALLQELSRKNAPSEADLAKASAQASQITSRTKAAIDEVTDKASKLLSKQLAKDLETAQTKMNAINRVYQRLGNVEIVYQAYQQGFSMLTSIQQLNTYATSVKDLEELQKASLQSKQALDNIDLAYQSIRKYDIDAEQPYYGSEGTSSIQGSIRRN